MKILVVSSVYPRFPEDSEVPWLRRSVACLKEKGNEIKILAPAYKGLKSHTIDGIEVKRFRYATKDLEILTHDEGAPSKMANKPWLQLLAIPYIISGIFKCLSLVRTYKPDIIHAHWPFPHGLIVLLAAKLFNIPVVLNFHGAELLLIKKHPFVRPVLAFLIGQADAIFANSSFTAKKIQQIRSCQVEISPYGTTLSTKASGVLHTVQEKFKILFVGRHIERKGITYLLQAAQKLSPEKFEIRIVGQGDLTNALKQEASNIPNVIFTGKLSPEDLEKEYREANVFVLPAIVDSKGDTEGLGVVLIEAVENDLVLVASNVGGIPDVVIHNKTGILVNQKSPQELADAFTTLAKDPELCNRLVQGAKEHVQKNFSWDAIIEKQLALYQKILKRKNSPENSEE